MRAISSWIQGPQFDGGDCMEKNLDIRVNPDKSRIETYVDGKLAKIDYSLSPGKIIYIHTEVPAELEGRGIAGQLAHFALEYAREEKLQVVPICRYVQSYLKRHPEYQDLVNLSSG
jgi:predicted GNAT family acetyltransferase